MKYTSLKLVVFIFISIGLATTSFAQTLKGKVVEWDEGMKMEMPLPAANIYWLSTVISATSNGEGEFSIPMKDSLPARLVVSFVGYHADTLLIQDNSFVKVVLKKSVELNEVTVESRVGTTSVSTLNTMNVEKLNEGEILKAACCNLSESFETNPTINVAYKDAVTGAKEIQLLGLSGIYSQLLTENIPNMRGIAGIYGLTFIPGPWMEGIQITKGSGSVLNGFESTTGQINVEFKKPNEKSTPRFYLNLFGEENGNMEINTFYKHKLSNKWSSVLMLHGNYMNQNNDRNGDGFLDVPHSQQINVYNRWQYDSGKHLESQIGVKYLYDKRHGGQMHSGISDNDADAKQYYITDVTNERVEVFGKLGVVFPEKPYMSIGNIVQGTYHELNSGIGPKTYKADEKTFYFQSIFQSIIGTTAHQYKVGINYQYDDLNEGYSSGLVNLHSSGLSLTSLSSNVTQAVPGVFGEYTYSYLEKFKVVAGLREDYHDSYEWIFTPRLHGKYNFTDNFIVRWSAGKSFRVPYAMADNISVLASSKSIRFDEAVMPEKAWNYGINLTQRWDAKMGEGTISVDLYRTDFINQLIVDAYSDSTTVHFYNLNGTSYANSFQVTLNQEFFKQLNVRVAYKTDDVKATYSRVIERKPLVPKDRVLLNLGYETKNRHWRFDYTVVREGTKKLVNNVTDSVYGKLPEQSPAFIVMHAQVTKVFRKFEVYGGGENLLDYRQMHPIINANNPFGNSFDATQVWGPVEGRRIYAGLRYSFK